MSGDALDAVGVTQRELLMEMRDDIRALRSAVDSVARDQALSVERRASMQRVADTITARLDSHEKAILDLQRWRDEAAGAIRLARWALGAGREPPRLGPDGAPDRGAHLPRRHPSRPLKEPAMAERKSRYRGLTTDGHGPDEHGLGALASPDDPRDVAIEDHPGYATVLAAAFPPTRLEPNTPPISNQGATPMCVAYSSANDQGHMDRPESGAFPAYDRKKFVAAIGGGPNGAYVRSALARRLHFGYPLVATPDKAAAHQISAYYRVPLNGGVVVVGPWYHSWFHPAASGKLPPPDYVVGGHAWWLRGWNDNAQAFRGRNSWGGGWGMGGDFLLPYAYLPRMQEVWRTLDRGA